jgi:hypothetical protein
MGIHVSLPQIIVYKTTSYWQESPRRIEWAGIQTSKDYESQPIDLRPYARSNFDNRQR